MIGQTISHYKILEKLGEGGMGVVYKAQDTKLDRLVALKFLPPHLAADETDKQRFIHEAKAASALDHPNICTIHEVDETPAGELFIAMAFYEGTSLNKKTERGPLKIDEALDVAIQTAEALQAAHEKGITHRDIKSSNILITEKGRAIVMDFGLARTTGATKLTKTGATLGTVPYMSPEQARGEKVDHRTDIWSLGAVLYEMITGQLPFKSEYQEAIVYSILNQNPAPVTSLRSGVPMELERVLTKCLEKHSHDRYQHLDELLVDLRKVRQRTTTEVSVPKRRLKPVWFAVPFVLLAFVGLYLLLPLKEGTRHIESLAVLPLENLSRDPEQEYFADGMTEAIITELSKISALKVISRTSAMRYKKSDKSMPQIARELGVDGLIEGSVLREGDQVRVTVQLIEGPSDKHLWANSYQRELRGILSLYTDLALAIANEIKVKLTPQEQALVGRVRSVNPKAYEAYLKGGYYRDKRTEDGFKKAVDYFREAIDKDSGYAPAYVGLADSYNLLARYNFLKPSEGFPKAKAAALKALQIDEGLAEAHTSLAFVARYHDNDWYGAEREFRRAIELNPRYSTGRHWYALSLSSLGRHVEAITEAKEAQKLDPLSLIINTNVAWVHYFARQYDQAAEQFQKALEMDPNFGLAHLRLGLTGVYPKKWTRS